MSNLIVNLTNQNKKCNEWLRDHVFYNTEFHADINQNQSLYIQFDSFNQLNQIGCPQNFQLEMDYLLLYPSRKLLIDDNLNLVDMLTMSYMENLIIRIKNILGFNQFTLNETLKQNTLLLSKYIVYFDSVNFDFYLNQKLITKEMCKKENFYGKNINYFWPMLNVYFNYDIFYSSDNPVCPYVFLNTHLKKLSLLQLTNSFIFKNRLSFINIDNDIPGSIGLNIPQLNFLEIDLTFEELTIDILCPHIFKKLTYLVVSGSPYQIQVNLFEKFNQLEYLTLNIDNLQTFLHYGIEWSLHLNNANHKHIILHMSEISFSKKSQYLYPDEDLCLFKMFPHKQLVIPSLDIVLSENVTCSCTIIWLIQNNARVENLSLFDFGIFFRNSSVKHCMYNYKTRFRLCRFEENLKNCNLTPPSHSTQFLTVIRVFFLFEWLKLVIEVYGKSLGCLLGLATNIVVMKVLKNRKFKKTFNNVMYKHIFSNAFFNFLFCLLQIFSLLNICVLPKSSFCSSVYKTSGAQYFKIYILLFLGNSLRLCCNFSYTLFSISRFYKSTSTKSKLFPKFEKLNLKRFYILMFVSCCLWSMFKLFEYRPNEIYSSFDKSFPYNRYDNLYCERVDDDSLKFLRNECQIFPILNMINNVLNNVLFLFVSVMIDISMIRFLNKDFEHKKELFHDQKHLDEALEHKNKIRKLIITNGILFFISHMPEFVATLLLLVFRKELKYFCFFYFSCTEINEIFEVFGFIGASVNFFVYKHFDHNFIESYKEIKEKLFKRATK